MMEYDGYKHAHILVVTTYQNHKTLLQNMRKTRVRNMRISLAGGERWERLIRFRDYDICQNVIIPDEKLFRGTKVDTFASQKSLQSSNKYLDAFKRKACTVLLNVSNVRTTHLNALVYNNMHLNEGFSYSTVFTPHLWLPITPYTVHLYNLQPIYEVV